MILIGLAGRARVGKDTAAAFLAGEYGVEVYSFAAPIKRALAAMLSMSVYDLEANKEGPIEGIGVSPRQLMQTLGTDWGRRMVRDDLWLCLAERYLGRLGGVCGAVVSDVRFHNEAVWVRSKGGVVIHIDRPDAPDVRAHESEAGVPRCGADLVVLNDGSLDMFHAKLRAAVDSFIQEAV